VRMLPLAAKFEILHVISSPRFRNSNQKGIYFLLALIIACRMEDSRTFSIAYSALN
jgi:hypothetical protein